MISVQLPPEVEASVRALAESSHRDVQSLIRDWVVDRLAAERKRAFDQELRKSLEVGLAGDVISDEESLARVVE